MDYYEYGRCVSYLLNQIREEKYVVIEDSQEVSSLIDELIEELQNIKRSSETISSEVIIHHNHSRIQNKLYRIFFQLQKINFGKQNIRNYKNEVLSIKGFFKDDWE